MHFRVQAFAALGLWATAAVSAHLPRSLDKPRCGIQVQASQRVQNLALAAVAQPEETIFIDTYIHVIATDETVDGGWLSDETLEAQMQVLNENYNGTGFQFNWISAETTRTINQSWTEFPIEWYFTYPEAVDWEVDWKRQLRKGGDDLTVLNLYFNPGLPAYGVAVLIEEQGEVDNFGIFDGAIILPSTVPDRPDPRINMGKTLSHEVGHWLGLYHTFQGGCDDGDHVQDTPPALAPLETFSYCDAPYNTCVDTLGPNGTDAPDPNENYMSYSTDPCMVEFTPLQITRMHQIWSAYRAKAT